MHRTLLAQILFGLSACLAGTAHAGTLGYRGMILADNPLVYYEFDETSGTTAFNSAATGSLYDGTFNTSLGPIAVNQASFAGGGASYDFNGGFVVVPPLASSLTEWTVSAWVNYDSRKLAGSNFLSNDQAGWNNDVLLGIGPEEGTQVPGGSVGVVHQGNPGETRDFAGSPLAAGQWHHVAATGSTAAGTLSIFIDGVLAASDTALVNGVTFNGAGGFGTANLVIGASRPDGLRPYDGYLDELAIFGSVLTPAQIAAHATGVSVPEPAGILLLAAGGLLLGWRRSRWCIIAHSGR